jgi:hypothetical protein
MRCAAFFRLADVVSTDNLAVSAQGFRRGANRVRKVSLSSGLFHHVS